MITRFSVGLFLLSIGFLTASWVNAMAQEPPSLEIFTSPDDAFQFIYPENYQLLVGDRILKATQGRHMTVPVCDFSSALVCVIYPVEDVGDQRVDNSRFEAAGFSVDAVRGSSAESECLTYADRFNREHADPFASQTTTINGFVFQYAAFSKVIAGHVQSLYLYRTFQKEHCYELRIAVSLSDEGVAAPAAGKNLPNYKSPVDRASENARMSLQLILSSFSFK